MIKKLTTVLLLVGIFAFLTAQGPVSRVRIFDTDRSHYVEFVLNENETVANRILNWKVNAADRTIDLTGNFTLAGNFTTAAAISIATDSGQGGKYLKTDGSGNYSWDTPASGSTTFLALTDTPANYTGSALYFLRVNAATNAVEFANFTNVENTAISTWTGTANVTTLGTIGAGNVDKIVTKTVVLKPVSEGTTLTTGDGKMYFVIPVELNGFDLVSVGAHVFTVSTSGLPTVQIYNATDAVDMLSTAITIDANEKDSSTAATPPVINTGADDVATGDEIRIDVDVAGTGTKGLEVRLGFRKPA